MPFDKKLFLSTLHTLSGLYSAPTPDSDAISTQEKILIDQINMVPDEAPLEGASSKEFFIDTMYLGGKISIKYEDGTGYTYQRPSQFIFNLCPYAVLDACVKKMESQQNLYNAFRGIEARTIDMHYLSSLGSNYGSYSHYRDNKRLIGEEPLNIKRRLLGIQKNIQIHKHRLQQQIKPNTDIKNEEPAHSTPPQQQTKPNTNIPHEEPIHSTPLQQQIKPNTDIKHEKINHSALQQHSSLWKNHWRSVVAIFFGTIMLILAFTPAGPALATALAMKATFAPVFAWIAHIGTAGIALGIGLFFSGFALGLPAWSLGMLSKLSAFVALAINVINTYVVLKLKHACERFCYNRNDYFVFGKALLIAIPFLLCTIITAVLSTIEFMLLCIAEFGSRTFRQLGAWQARLFNHTLAPSSEKIMMLPTPEITLHMLPAFLKTSKHPPSAYRAHFFPHLHALVSGQVQERWSFEKDFIHTRAQWLVNDTLSTAQNPYDAAQENPSPPSP